MPFTPHERALLLVAPRIGPTVIDRLEQAGVDSFAKLRALGVDAAVQLVCSRVESRAWGNRRSALLQVLATTAMAVCTGESLASPKIATEAVGGACHV